MDVTVQEATKASADVDALVEMVLELHAHHEACDPRCRKMSAEAPGMEREEVLRMLDDEHVRVVLAEEGSGAIIGMAVGVVRRAPDHVPAISGEIRRVFVKADRRGRRVARRLLAPLCDFFTAHGVEDVSLTYMINNDLSRRFWTHLGFQPFLTMAKTTLSDLAGRLSE